MAATTERPAARAVLTVGAALGVAYLAYVAHFRPGLFGLNYEVFHGAGTAFLDGEAVYGVAHGRYGYLRYVYPPVTLLGFAPFAALPYPVAFTLHTVLSVGCGLLMTHVLVAFLRRHGAPLTSVDRILVAAFCVASPLSMPSTVFGQVNLALALAFAIGFTRLDLGAEPLAGAAFGLAALVKVFPAAVGLWLLRRRAWLAVGTAVLVGGGGLVVGLALDPSLTVEWLTTGLLDRAGDDAFVGGLPPGAAYLTLQRPLSVLFPDAGALPRTLGAALLVAPLLGYLYRALDPGTLRGGLVGAYATVAGFLLVLPSYPIYYVLLYFPVVPMLYVFEGRAYRLAVVGAALLAVPLRLDDAGRLTGALGPVGDTLLAVVTPLLTLSSTALFGVGLLFAACTVVVGQSS